MNEQDIEEILAKLQELKNLLSSKSNELIYIHVNDNKLLEALISAVDVLIDSIINNLKENKNIVVSEFNLKFILVKVDIVIRLIGSIHNSSSQEVWKKYDEIYSALMSIDNVLENIVNIQRSEELKVNSEKYFDSFSENINKSNILLNNLQNYLVHDVYDSEWRRFNKIAFRYEIAFYVVLILLAAYFFGWYVDLNTSILKFKFAEQFYSNHSAGFYIQKISLLILSTTLMAFLLKRSFMIRRLADESYRTAKELKAIAPFISSLPSEMKQKFRFDMGYKYFGNHINHESYTSGENLMHENIKANTDFIKAINDLKTSDNRKANS
ncbi:hypothetical protein E2R16_14850 [Acinetobacter seifertii]|uniref:Uncharacterized protein n=1 Tax=Acinetobacter seifertii TaxID=1530123 RepID=A0A5E9PFJ3_9GAMM|nr:hypothetical protein [Acinetobacter seifertii]TEU26361.1 hypothetical protein E2R16_14850 [Acinetobacter seifertii]